MTIKKLTALVTALVIAVLSLTACGKKTVDESLLNIDGEFIDTDGLIMLTANGVEVPFDEYRYMYNYVESAYFSNIDDATWDSDPQYFQSLLDYTEYLTLDNCWGDMLANEYGIELSEQDYADIDAYMEEQRNAFDSPEAFEQALADSSITEDLLKRIVTRQFLCNRVYEDLFQKEGAPLSPSDDEIKTDLSENWRRVYHILILFDHFANAADYEDATEDELKAAAREYAEELLERAKNGEDFYQLSQDYGEDPGMTDNTEGYFFTYGEMVEPFETASFELEVGEISDIVETSYGYHIILRLEQDDYTEENWDSVRDDYVNREFNEYVDNLIDTADIKYCEYYDKLVHGSIR